MPFSSLSQKCRSWLMEDVAPLWMARGIDRDSGLFVENLDAENGKASGPQRSMVQARQLYSFRLLAEIDPKLKPELHPLLEKAAGAFIKRYQQPSGAFVNAILPDGTIANADVDLYAQAFGLFGLAQAYILNPRRDYKEAAFKLLAYLRRERQNPAGGFSEEIRGQKLYQSNPHMHLFEAALTWFEVDSDPIWREFADELFRLCRDKLIAADSKLLFEHFDENWQPLKFAEKNLPFFEPGHHYEWSWLLGIYARLTRQDLRQMRLGLYDVADQKGLDAQKHVAIDQVWSDLTPKATTARFWPQCERIKAAVLFAHESEGIVRKAYETSASEAMTALFQYFEREPAGTWHDAMEASGEFTASPIKASSLYHIIGAMSEFTAVYSDL